MPNVPTTLVSFETTEGTLMNVDVSPDGTSLVFDLLGDIYLLPITGGNGIALTSGRAWDQAPRYSRDGQYLFFLSDRKGYRNIWRLSLLDRSLRQVTNSDSEIRGGLTWSQDWDHLLVGVAAANSAEFILHAVDPASGRMTPINEPEGPFIDLDTYEVLRDRIRIFSGVETRGGHVFFSKPQRSAGSPSLLDTTVRIFRFDREEHVQTSVTRKNAVSNEYRPLLSHDGALLAYYRQYNDRGTEIRILNRATGQDRALIALKNADDAYYYAVQETTPNYAFTPDDKYLVLWHGGKIHRVNLEDGSNDIIPFHVNVKREVWVHAEPTMQHIKEVGEASTIRWPSLSPDGGTMLFSAVGYIWTMDETGHIQRLTETSDFQYMPTLSPDGKLVAYISFEQSGQEYGHGRLMIAKLSGGPPRELLSDANADYLLPRWSHDGSMIALIRESKEDMEGDNAAAVFGWTSTAGGTFHPVAPAPASTDPISWFIYSRFVDFDAMDRHLWFSFPRSRYETVLAIADLDGENFRILASGTPEVRGITPAPDLRHLALTRSDGTVWVLPFRRQGKEVGASTLAPEAYRVSESGGYYVDWYKPDRLTFGFATKVYRFGLPGRRLECINVKLPFSKIQSFRKIKTARPIAFRGARLITIANESGAGPIIESGTLVVDGARIAAVGPIGEVVVPADAIIIDASGTTIMPGLIDTHYHRIGGPGLSAFRLPNTRFGDDSAIMYGITSAWEPGGPLNDGVPAMRDLQAAGRVLGPRWSHSAQGTVGYPWELLSDYAVAHSMVQQHFELGASVLKEYNTPTRQQQQWLSAAAHQMGLGIVSHIGNFTKMMTGITDGYTGGDHPYVPAPSFRDVQEMLRQSGYIWTPNIVIPPGSVVGTRQREKDYFCHALIHWQDKTKIEGSRIERICHKNMRNIDVPFHIHRVSRVARQAAKAASHGARIGVSAHGMPGSGLHREMWFLWKGGMLIEEVLRAATIVNAGKLGLQEEVGSLEADKIADFMILKKNPLNNILNTLALDYTVQSGVVYDSDTALRIEPRKLRMVIDASHTEIGPVRSRGIE